MIALAAENLKQTAKQLTESRKKAVQPIEKYMVSQLVKLGIVNAQFKVDMRQVSDFLPNGTDEISFLFSANKNREVQPVQMVASGGEMSRLMLSIN